MDVSEPGSPFSGGWKEAGTAGPQRRPAPPHPPTSCGSFQPGDLSSGPRSEGLPRGLQARASRLWRSNPGPVSAPHSRMKPGTHVAIKPSARESQEPQRILVAQVVGPNAGKTRGCPFDSLENGLLLPGIQYLCRSEWCLAIFPFHQDPLVVPRQDLKWWLGTPSGAGRGRIPCSPGQPPSRCPALRPWSPAGSAVPQPRVLGEDKGSGRSQARGPAQKRGFHFSEEVKEDK